MYKLYEISQASTFFSYRLLAEGCRNALGRLMEQHYTILKSGAHGGRTIFAIHDINGNLVSATGPR